MKRISIAAVSFAYIAVAVGCFSPRIEAGLRPTAEYLPLPDQWRESSDVVLGTVEEGVWTGRVTPVSAPDIQVSSVYLCKFPITVRAALKGEIRPGHISVYWFSVARTCPRLAPFETVVFLRREAGVLRVLDDLRGTMLPQSHQVDWAREIQLSGGVSHAVVKALLVPGLATPREGYGLAFPWRVDTAIAIAGIDYSLEVVNEALSLLSETEKAPIYVHFGNRPYRMCRSSARSHNAYRNSDPQDEREEFRLEIAVLRAQLANRSLEALMSALGVSSERQLREKLQMLVCFDDSSIKDLARQAFSRWFGEKLFTCLRCSE